MAVFSQLAGLVILLAGLGYWFWRLIGKPEPWRSLTWLWCALAGFCLGLLLLQVLVYLDWPLRRTAPLLLAFASAGLASLGWRVWRDRGVSLAMHWREVMWVLAAGVGAGCGHSTSLVGIGCDKFLGHAQIDHVNYVSVAQFLIDEPFSTKLPDIGLRPWLWRVVELKEDRITDCIALGVATVFSGSDAQRAWGPTAVFFTGLLGLALAGMWRVAGSVSGRVACVLGLVGALAPVVTRIYLIGFFSQLTSLFVFPALIALCRPGALSSWRAIGLVTVLLGFLAGAYPEFWPIGLAVSGTMILGWRLPVRQRLFLAALPLGSVLLTGAYAVTIVGGLIDRPQGQLQQPLRMGGFAPGGISWHGLGWNFFSTGEIFAGWLGVLVALGLLLGVMLQPRHRRWHWGLALTAPAVLAATLLWQSPRPVYLIYKLLSEFSPIVLGLAAVGWVRALGHLGPWPRRAGVVVLGLIGGWVVISGVRGHGQLVAESRLDETQRLRLLWAARDRATHAPGSEFLVASGNSLIGAWLAYFARDSAVYYDLPAVADRRAPSESAAFRKIPAGRKLDWLDLDRTGPVGAYEPSPSVELQGARGSFLMKNNRRVLLLGGQADLIITRAAGFAPMERGFFLECGLMAAPGAGLSKVVISDDRGQRHEFQVGGATPLSVRLLVRPGRNTYTFRAGSFSGDDTLTGPDRDLLLLQALSLEPAVSDERGAQPAQLKAP